MRVLLIGGTRFVGRHIAQAALDAGHEVTLFNRGLTNPELFPDAEHVHGDRRAGGLAVLRGRRFDAIVDSSAYFPADVEAASEVAADRYVLVSTGSVYYWPRRLARGGTVLAAEPDQPVQFIDARDLGEWTIASAEAGTTGVFNTTGFPMSFAALLGACAEAAGSAAEPVWAGDRFLLDNGVEPWADLPLWLPAETAGFLAVDERGTQRRSAHAAPRRHDRRRPALGRRARRGRAARRDAAGARGRAAGAPLEVKQ